METIKLKNSYSHHSPSFRSQSKKPRMTTQDCYIKATLRADETLLQLQQADNKNQIYRDLMSKK